MATREEQDILRLLVQHVSRAFYEPKFTIIMDQLSRHPVIKDDELAGRIGLQAKELNKLMAVLSNDRLIHVYRQNELKEGAQRAVPRQYYYIDYQHFCNVVKWRVAEMRRIIDSGLRNELDNKGYVCPQCGKLYSPLQVDKLIDYARGVFLCEDCHAELIDNENAESVKGSQDRMQRFNKQMRFIREGLRKTEAMVLPALDVPSWVKNNTTESDQIKTDDTSGLKVAGSGPGSNRTDDGIGIVMSMDKDEATRRQERDAEAAAKRQQNVLPSWHLKSTITGDLTALGIQESSRTQTAGSGEGGLASGSNDELLKGLGVMGSRPKDPLLVAAVEDVKPVINKESDYYDQYYASLAASAAASTPVTPSGPFADDFVEGEEQKPSVEYLDLLNGYNKRSRSREDEGQSTRKAFKTESETSMNGSGTLNVEPQEDERNAAEQDDPVVSVNGQPKLFSEVTEEDQELMSPEEYTTYFEVYQART